MKPFPTLYVASANAHKLEEIHTILGKEFSLVSMQTLGKVPELIENEDTFEGNALARPRSWQPGCFERVLETPHG